MATTEQTTLGEADQMVTESRAGNGEDVPTIIVEDDEGREQCPYCKEWFHRIGQHWTRSSCDFPPITEYKIQLCKGMMLGDGTLNRSNRNPRLIAGMTNKSFLDWLSDELGWVGSCVSLKATATESAKNMRRSGFSDTNPEDSLDVYRITSISHPMFGRFASWYDTGEIVFPFGLSVSNVALKIWYIGDGGLDYGGGCTKSGVRFSSVNESQRPAQIKGALQEHGFTIGHSDNIFRLFVEDTNDFFELIGDPVPGFEYKWVYDDWDRYQRLKDECREKHCTQTLE